jgi:hypothetical protein
VTTEGWQVELLRFTLFPASPVDPDDHKWWSAVCEGEPEVSQKRALPPVFTQEGAFEGARLLHQVAADRIDWSLRLSPQQAFAGQSLPTVGPLRDVQRRFLEVARKWLGHEQCPPARRLAYALVLLQPVDSRIEGLERLAGYLPSVTLDVHNAEDFLYQINRPRMTGNGDEALRINRLEKWSLVRAQLVEMALGTTPSGGTTTFGKYAARLELDINTAADRIVAIPNEQQGQLLKLLVAFSDEIAEKGDIA